MSPSIDVAALAAAYAEKSPQDVLKLAFDLFGDDLWISFSGAEDVVLLADHSKLGRKASFFFAPTIELSCVIVDPAADAGFCRKIEAAGPEILVAS